jgi:hypothetical protein
MQTSNLVEKLAELERLASEIYTELQSVPTKPDVRNSRYSDLNHRIIMGQVLYNIRWIQNELGEETK